MSSVESAPQVHSRDLHTESISWISTAYLFSKFCLHNCQLPKDRQYDFASHDFAGAKATHRIFRSHGTASSISFFL